MVYTLYNIYLDKIACFVLERIMSYKKETGFINPLNIDETVPDSRSEVSESTSGVASNAVELDEEDKNEYLTSWHIRFFF